ncbi:hypothetical protein [Streptomyces sp. NPDC055140]
MPATLTYHHARADLTFTWDGGTQITIRPGNTVPSWGVYPDRIDIREPDMWRSDLLPTDQRPPHRTGLDVVLLPFTPQALRDACGAWWEGREINTGRDFAQHPWAWDVFGGKVRVRYQGGAAIEATPADSEDWRPVIDLWANDRTPADVTTTWLTRRVDGWTTGVLEQEGICTPQQGAPDPVRHGDRAHDEIVAWTTRSLPTQAKADSITGAWHTWISTTARDVWNAPGGPGPWRNAGIAERPITDRAAWTYQDATADGTRFNFVWRGGKAVHVTSPDNPRLATLDDSTFLLHPREQATGTLLAWLQKQAQQWIAACNTANTHVPTPYTTLRHAPWRIVLTGPGLHREAPYLTEDEVYAAARKAQHQAANDQGVTFRSLTSYTDHANGVRGIRVQRRNPDENRWETHSRPWHKNTPAEDALTPYSSGHPAS